MNNSLSIIGTVVWLVALGVGIYCAVLASQYDDQKWEQVGQNRMLFVAGCPIGAFCCGVVGLALSAWFYFGIKPKLDALA